jgi:hypothetical protein
MNLDSYVKECVVIKPEKGEDGMRRYIRLDTGKIVPPQSIEFLNEPAGLISHDGKSNKKVVIHTRNSYLQENLNTIVLGDELVPQNIWSYSPCKMKW